MWYVRSVFAQPTLRHARRSFLTICVFQFIVFADDGPFASLDPDQFDKGSAVGGDFGVVLIIVSPHANGAYLVNVRIRKIGVDESLADSLSEFPSDTIVSDSTVAEFVRNIAVRADLACRSATGVGETPSNVLHRFRLLQAMKRFAVPTGTT